MIVEGHGKGFSGQKVQPDKDLREESLACLRNHRPSVLLVPEARGKRRQTMRLEMAAAAADKELGLSHEGDQGDWVMLGWKLTYPRYHPRGSRPLAQGCGRAEPGWGWWGVSMKLFFCPQLRGHLQLMGPPGARGTGLFGFTTPLPSPSVSGGQEKRKRYADFLLGPGACEPRRVLRKGGGRGGAQKGLPAHTLSAE